MIMKELNTHRYTKVRPIVVIPKSFQLRRWRGLQTNFASGSILEEKLINNREGGNVPNGKSNDSTCNKSLQNSDL